MDIDALVDSLPEPVINLISDLQDEVQDLQKSLDEALASQEQEQEPTLDPVAKALQENPAFAEILKAKEARLAEVEKALEETRVSKANEAWTARTRSFDGVVGDPASFGAMLRDINDFNPEYAEEITKTLAAASEKIRLSDLFSEGGHGSSMGGGSAFDQATSIAKSMVEEGRASDIETARADVWDSHPHLYAQYQTERQAR